MALVCRRQVQATVRRPPPGAGGNYKIEKENNVPRLSLAVLADDRITYDGASSYFGQCDRVRVVPADSRALAEIIVLFAHTVTEQTLARMRQALSESERPDTQVILVAEAISEPQLLRAVRYGLVGFLPRGQTSMGEVLRATLGAQQGRSELPDRLVKLLMDQIRAIHQDALERRGSGPGGFDDRDIDVLRLLADGVDTAGIAAKLNYSERTIKNILARMMLRNGLRNRAHVIAYAMRAGAL